MGNWTFKINTSKARKEVRSVKTTSDRRLAIREYISAKRHNKKLSRNHNNLDAMREIASIERFFRSGWFGVLTTIDPEMLIRKLQEEVRA